MSSCEDAVIIQLDSFSTSNHHTEYYHEYYSNNLNYQNFAKTIRSEILKNTAKAKAHFQAYKIVDSILYIPHKTVCDILVELDKYSIDERLLNLEKYSKLRKFMKDMETVHSRNYNSFRRASDVYSHNKIFLYIIATKNETLHESFEIMQELKVNEEFAKSLMKYYSHRPLHEFPRAIFENRNTVIELVKHNILTLSLVKDQMLCDREIIIQACLHNPLALQYANKALKNDKSLVMKCLGKRFNTLIYVGKSLLSDVEVLRRAMWAKQEWRNEIYDTMTLEQLIEEIVRKKPIMILKFSHLLKGLDFRIGPSENWPNSFEIVIDKSPFPMQSRILLEKNHNGILKNIEDERVQMQLLYSGYAERYASLKTLLTQNITPIPHNISGETLEEIFILENNLEGLLYCKSELKNDKSFILNYLKSSPNKSILRNSILSIGENLLQDTEVLLEYLNTIGHAPKQELSLNQLMKEIVSEYPFSIIRFYNLLNNEVEFTIKEHGVLQISNNLVKFRCKEVLPYITDPQIAELFVRFSIHYYCNLSDEMKQATWKILIFEMKKKVYVEKIPSPLRKDREIVRYLLTTPSPDRGYIDNVTKIAIEAFPTDREIMELVFIFNNRSLSSITSFNQDLDFCFWAIKINILAFMNLPLSVRNKRDLVKKTLNECFSQGGLQLTTLISHLKTEARQIYNLLYKELSEDKQVLDSITFNELDISELNRRNQILKYEIYEKGRMPNIPKF